MKTNNSTPVGFTLLELLIAIAIIGLLSAIVLASLNAARVKSRDAERQRTIHEIESALQLYWTDTGTYPVVAFPVDITVLIPFLVPKYISGINYDTTNLNGFSPQYYSSSSSATESYLIYEPTEKQQSVTPSAYGCRTGVGTLVDGSGLYSTAPRC